MAETITVAIPVYNEEKHIVEALMSIQRQSYANIKILIADNASTDRTVHLIRWYNIYDKRIKLIQHNENRGCAGNLKALVDNCETDIMVFLSANDILKRGAVAEIHRLFQLDERIAVITRPYYFFNSRDPEKPIRWTKRKNLTYADIIASCGQMSGIGIRKKYLSKTFSNRKFVEFVSAIYPMIPRKNWWTKVRFAQKPTCAVRNTGGGSYNSYVYEESAIQNWIFATDWKTAGEIHNKNYVHLIQVRAYGGLEPLFWEWYYLGELNPKMTRTLTYYLWMMALSLCPAWLLRNLVRWWWNRR